MAIVLEELEIAAQPLPRLVDGVVIEPSPRWVRAYAGGVAVADSKRALLAFEPRRLPVYWFPAADVRTDLLGPAADPAARSGRVRWSLAVGDRTIRHAAWSLADLELDPARAALRDHFAFYWDAMDAWYEEDDEVYVHPRDPYARVDVLHSSRHVRVELAGHLLAESRRPRLLFETGLPTRHYLPKQDVRMDLLEASPTRTRCPYKGEASYWSLRLGDTLIPDIAWSYREPIPECPKIADLVCFFDEKVDTTVDGELRPRPITDWS